MATKKSGDFEAAIDRLEAIVKELEGGEISLDESVRLYREGRELARKCEAMLKAAQDEVEAASREGAERASVGRTARTEPAPNGGLPL